MEGEIIIASSPVDTGVNSWGLNSGTKLLNYKACSSPRHGLTSVGSRFIASSQIPASRSASTAPIYFWSWDKPQFGVKSFPAEPIGPLTANSEGTYLIGGGSSGSIYFWEVASGKLLNKWHAHYRSVTCLALSDDDSLLISGSDDGCVRVWNLIMIFDVLKAQSGLSYLYSWTEHALRVTDIVVGRGLSNSIIISSSEDRTCKIFSLSEGKILRSIPLDSVADALAIDPGEHRFYAGCRDGKIYIKSLNAENNPTIGILFDHSVAVTSIACRDGTTLVSGSEDGIIRIWDIMTQHVVRVLKHAKAPISNVLLVKPTRQGTNLAHQLPLSKYVDSSEGDLGRNTVILPQPCWKPNFLSSGLMGRQLKELQENNSSAVAEMEVERLRIENKKLVEMAEKWKKLCQDQQSFYVKELLDHTKP
ncbi:protein ROOT INITIATION DEFECTIVE 3-like [Carex rostrata]